MDKNKEKEKTLLTSDLNNYTLDTDDVGVVLEEEIFNVQKLSREIERLKDKIYEIDDAYAGKFRRMKKRIEDLEDEVSSLKNFQKETKSRGFW